MQGPANFKREDILQAIEIIYMASSDTEKMWREQFDLHLHVSVRLQIHARQLQLPCPLRICLGSSKLIHDFANQGSPPRLMTCTQATAGVAIEVFVKQGVVPRGVLLEAIGIAKHGPPLVVPVLSKQPQKSLGYLQRTIPKVHLPLGPCWEVDFQGILEVEVVMLKALKQQVIDGEPYGTPPVAVAAKHTRGALSRLISDRVLGILDGELVGVVLVPFGQGSNTVRAKELILVEQVAQDAGKASTGDQGKEDAIGGGIGAPRICRVRNVCEVNVVDEVRALLDKPRHTLAEVGELGKNIGLKRNHGKHWQKADQ
mmetsp:Transcript_37937/g.61467  ORF Transcript_37937/g.61467 Transcript_37937/m.61467 type:complete len:314 (+) Transcript_37937:417-1358(+)